MKRTSFGVLALTLALAGCLLIDPWDRVASEPIPSTDGAVSDGREVTDVPPAPDARESQQPSRVPSQSMYDRAVWLGRCTGTRVAARHVLTALGCVVPTDAGPATATFYASGPSPDPTQTAQVIRIASPPGTSASGDRTADNGDFADLALLELDHDVPVAVAAAMSWTFPASGTKGIKVGVEPQNDSDKLGLLRAVEDTTDSVLDSGGAFRTRYAYTDVGGSFYVGGLLTGVLSVPDGPLGRFTSLPHHLPWVLDAMHYQWSGGPSVPDRVFTGAVHQTFNGLSLIHI